MDLPNLIANYLLILRLHNLLLTSLIHHLLLEMCIARPACISIEIAS